MVRKTDKAVAALAAAVEGYLAKYSDARSCVIKELQFDIFGFSRGEKVFHITAQHECRFNFALNSVKPAWPELALPGVHSDIGGGYNPEEHEAYFLTRPQFETVPLSTPDSDTRVYQQTCEQLKVMDTYPAIAPVFQSVEIEINAWHDDRMPADRYGTLQKRSGAALIIDRPTRNDWSKVVLRVMLDAAQDAGVVFDPILPKDDHLSLRSELNSLCEKAIMGGNKTWK